MEKEAMLIELQKKVIALEVRIAELEAQLNNYYHTHFPVQVPNPPNYAPYPFFTFPPYTTC